MSDAARSRRRRARQRLLKRAFRVYWRPVLSERTFWIIWIGIAVLAVGYSVGLLVLLVTAA